MATATFDSAFTSTEADQTKHAINVHVVMYMDGVVLASASEFAVNKTFTFRGSIVRRRRNYTGSYEWVLFNEQGDVITYCVSRKDALSAAGAEAVSLWNEYERTRRAAKHAAEREAVANHPVDCIWCATGEYVHLPMLPNYPDAHVYVPARNPR